MSVVTRFQRAISSMSRRCTVMHPQSGGAGYRGKVVDALIQQMDFYPTFCELLGAEAPDWLQGKSLMSLIRGQTDRVHDAIFTEQTYHCGRVPQPLRAVRTERYKYIRCYKTDQPRGVDRGPASPLGFSQCSE